MKYIGFHDIKTMCVAFLSTDCYYIVITLMNLAGGASFYKIEYVTPNTGAGDVLPSHIGTCGKFEVSLWMFLKVSGLSLDGMNGLADLSIMYFSCA